MAILAIWDLYEIYMRFIWDLVWLRGDWSCQGFRLFQALGNSDSWFTGNKQGNELAQLYQVTILFWILCMYRCYIFLMMFIHVYHLWIAFGSLAVFRCRAGCTIFLWDCTSSGSHMNSVNQLTRIESVKSFHIRLPIFESIEFAISILNTQWISSESRWSDRGAPTWPVRDIVQRPWQCCPRCRAASHRNGAPAAWSAPGSAIEWWYVVSTHDTFITHH